MSAPLPRPAPRPSFKGQPVRPADTLTPPSVMLMGPSGTGKTSSILTLLRLGMKVNVLVTEGTGAEVLLDALEREQKRDSNIDPSLLHWKQITPSNLDLETMIRKATLSNRMGAGALQALETGLDRDQYPQFLNLLRACQNFVSDKDGTELGNIASWGDDTAFVLDSMTGLNTMVTQHVCGMRPTMTQPEYGIVQNHLRDILMLWTSLRCYFVMTAHVERETNQVTGEVRVMSSSVGKALAPDIPTMFSEVILTGRKGEQFNWSTLDPKADVKHRALAMSASLRPDFTPIIETHRRRVALAKEGGPTT